MAIPKRNQLLETGFGFTLEELELNRKGLLSEAQLKKVQRQHSIQRFSLMAGMVLFSLITVATIVSAILPFTDSSVPISVFLSWLPVVVVIGIVFMMSYRQYKRLAKGEIQVIEGQVQMDRVPSYDPSGFLHRLPPAFYIQNGWRKYHIAQGHQFKAMKGLVYRFYIVPNGRMPVILSAEQVKKSS